MPDDAWGEWLPESRWRFSSSSWTGPEAGEDASSVYADTVVETVAVRDIGVGPRSRALTTLAAQEESEPARERGCGVFRLPESSDTCDGLKDVGSGATRDDSWDVESVSSSSSSSSAVPWPCSLCGLGRVAIEISAMCLGAGWGWGWAMMGGVYGFKSNPKFSCCGVKS